MSSQSSHFAPQESTSLPWMIPRKGSAALLGWAVPSRGLLWDLPGCFVLIVHMHLQRGHLPVCQEMPTSLSIPYNQSQLSLLVSSHSTAPDVTRAPLLRSKDNPVNASSWAQPEPRALTAEHLSSPVCPQPMSGGAEPGELVLVPGNSAGHGTFSSSLQLKHLHS